jgi:hypothetical protein
LFASRKLTNTADLKVGATNHQADLKVGDTNQQGDLKVCATYVTCQ